MSLVQFTADGAVGLIRLDRPPVNALNRALVSDLAGAGTRMPDSACIVLMQKCMIRYG